MLWKRGFSRLIVVAAIVAVDMVPLAVAAGSEHVAPQFVDAIPQLKGSKTPVYLPGWIPTWTGKIYATGELGEFEYPAGYEVTLAVRPGMPCNADTLFYLSAGKGPLTKSRGRTKVILKHGWVGYYNNGGNFHTLDWAIGKFSYHLAVYKPQSDLVKVANSMVLVQVK